MLTYLAKVVLRIKTHIYVKTVIRTEVCLTYLH